MATKYQSLEQQLIQETWITLDQYLKYHAGMLEDFKRIKEYKEKYFKKINKKNIGQWSNVPSKTLKVAIDNNLI